jgi:Mg-chelatase subunit ChlD
MPRMNRRTVSCVLCAFVLGVAMPICSTAQDAPASGAKPSPITVRLTASGNTAAPALDKASLSFTIDNKPAEVLSIHPAKNEPLLFVVLMDESTSMRARGEEMKDAALAIFKGLSSEGSQGYLGFFDVASSFTSRPVTVQEAQQILAKRQIGGGSAVFDAIAQSSYGILSRERNPNIPRRAIILITDGDDNQSKTPLDEAIQAAQRDGAAIFALSVDSHGPGERVLKDASAKTGGLEVTPRSIAEGVTPLLKAIDAQWAVTILPQQMPDKKLHTLNLHSLQSNVNLSAPAKILLQ